MQVRCYQWMLPLKNANTRMVRNFTSFRSVSSREKGEKYFDALYESKFILYCLMLLKA